MSPKGKDPSVQVLGDKVIIRGDDGRITKTYTDPVAAQRIRRVPTPVNLRDRLSAVTGGMAETLSRLAEIAMGKAQVYELESGKVFTQVPTPEVQLKALIYMTDQVYGKAVPQTDTLKAIKESEEVARYEALNSEELRKLVYQDEETFNMLKTLVAEGETFRKGSHEDSGTRREASEAPRANAEDGTGGGANRED